MTALKQGFTPDALVDDMSALLYIIRTQIENRVNTIDIVRVNNVNEDNTIDVIPIIKGVDNDNNPIEEVPIYGVPYIRWQFGLNSIKATPKVGDIGLFLICKKDTSAISAGIVGNNSKFNAGNGIYLGGLNGLNEEPTQFIEFKDNEITITGTGKININATTANVNAETTNINSTNINLGGEGGKKVCLDGDNVYAGQTVIGTVKSSSTTTNSL